jgi:hypothetical protein
MKFAKLVGVLIAVGTLTGCEEARSHVLPPHPKVVAQQGTDGFVGLDYTANVFCTVRNEGGNGTVKITATYFQGGAWQRTTTVAMAAGEMREVSFVFPEAELLSFDSRKFSCTSS